MLSRIKRILGLGELKASSKAWPFDQPENCATLTMRQVLSGEEPVLRVTHDEDDHGWQFIGTTDANMEDVTIVSLREIVDRDPSVIKVADLPPGWSATRSAPGASWRRSKRSSVE